MKLLQLLATEPSNDIFATYYNEMLQENPWLAWGLPLFAYLAILSIIVLVGFSIWAIFKKPKTNNHISQIKSEKDEE